MSVSFKIDFKNLYDLDSMSEDYKRTSFRTELKKGENTLLNVRIRDEPHELMPNVFNLSFGPLNSKGRIDDRAELKHADYSKVFSTILFTAFNYLEKNPKHYLGIDGSDNSRAYYYFRAMQRNFSYLDRHFQMFGIKYYVRITRLGRTVYANPFDFDDVIANAARIKKGDQISQDFMYNYFIFNMK
jgi:hypothetical protein